MQIESHDVLLVLGIRGAGKSYWTNHTLVPKCRRVVVWDPHAEYKTREVVYLDDLLEEPDRLDKEALSISVVPRWRTPEDLCEQFAVFSDLVQTFAPGTVLVVEECALLMRATGSLVYLATQSRHWEVPLVLVSQRAVRIHKDAREQCSRIVSFRQSSPDDVAALVDRCGPEAERVRKLPRREFWAWDESQAFEDNPTTDGAEKESCRT